VSAIPVAVADRFLGLLALIALVATLAAVGMLVTRRVPAWAPRAALPTAAAITVVTTLGSLYYSEVAGYPPCVLCWYQRIAIYPQVVILGVAAWRRDARVWMTSVPLAAIGIAISAWHVAVERNPALAGPCDPDNPCAIRWVEEFGFLTIPTMALIAGLAIVALTLLARRAADDRAAGTDRPTERTPA